MKKLLSAALAAVMLGAMAIPAVSAENPASPTTADKITDRSGTITIHKFDPALVKHVDNDPQKEIDVNASVTAEAGVKDAEFTAFKVLDYDVTTGTYSVNANFSDITLDNVIKATETTYTMYGTTSELEKEISKMQKDAATLTSSEKATTNASGAATITVAHPGVYLVEETVVPDNYIVTTQAFLVSVPTFNGETDEWEYDVVALPKNTKMDVDKSIDDAKDATVGTDENNDSFAVGDIIDYTVTIDVPNYGRSTNYPDYQVTDAMAIYDKEANENGVFGITRFNNLNMTFTDTLGNGLTFLPNSLKIAVETRAGYLEKGDEKKTAVSKASETPTAVKQVTYTMAEASAQDKHVGDYTLTTPAPSSTNGFVVDIAWAALNDYQGQTITLTYSAQINENAAAGTAESNDVTVSFVKDPTSKTSGDPTDPPRDTDTDTGNNAYTYAMDLTKQFDNAADATKANDVVFTMKDAANNSMLFTEDGDNTYTVWTGRTLTQGETTYAIPATYGNVSTDAGFVADNAIPNGDFANFKTLTANVSPKNNGVLNINGLKDGTYTLTETKTADGFSILTAPLTVVVSEVIVEGKVTAQVSATVDNAANAVVCNDPTDGHFAFTVNNPKAKFFSLPTTGGLGLWLFTVGGGVLMAGAIIFITVLRKKKNS